MRALVLIGLAGAVACGDNTGLALTLRAPDGPAGASRIELVLADPDTIETVQGQLTGGDVRYYRQKSTAGVIEELARLDGFVVRIESQRDQAFVPFVIAYGEGPQPIAIGAVPDPQGLPLALEIPDGSRIEATVSMIPLLPADLTKGVLRGQVAEIRCDGNGDTWSSGVAWQPPAGLQLRLLRPDPDAGAGLDASRRPLDLDCDAHAADGGDCDDVRARINHDAVEACDGEDTNCDGAQFSVAQCTPPATECGQGSTEGIQVCRDVEAGTEITSCLGSPACRCRLGNPGPCSKCILGFEGDAAPVKPCAPSAAKIQLPLGTCTPLKPCTVALVQDEGPWEAGVAADPAADFGRSAEVSLDEVWLRVKPELSSLAAMPGSSVGAVHLVISNGATLLRYIGIDLELANLRIDSCSNLNTPAGYFAMACSVTL